MTKEIMGIKKYWELYPNNPIYIEDTDKYVIDLTELEQYLLDLMDYLETNVDEVIKMVIDGDIKYYGTNVKKAELEENFMIDWLEKIDLKLDGGDKYYPSKFAQEGLKELVKDFNDCYADKYCAINENLIIKPNAEDLREIYVDLKAMDSERR